MILRASGRARKEEQDIGFYRSLLPEVFEIAGLKIVRWGEFRKIGPHAEISVGLASEYLSKSLAKVALTVATLQADMTNYLEQDPEMIIIREVPKVPKLSSTPQLPRASMISAKNKIAQSIVEYSELLAEEVDTGMRQEIYNTLDLLKKQLNQELEKEKSRGRSMIYGDG